MGQVKTVVQKRFVAKRMEEMPRKKLQWLWPERIALGALTVLAGDFQSGKSLLAADLAARVSHGEAWPDGRASLGPSEVLLLSHEGDPRDALEAAGADLGRVVVLEEVKELVKSQKNKGNAGNAEDAESCDEGVEGVDGLEGFIPHPRPLSLEHKGEGSLEDGLEVAKRRPINLWIDLDVLEKQLGRMENCRLVIVDPVDAHFTGGNTVAARMWLKSLTMMAAQYGVAMVLVTGLKEGRKSASCRLAGGLGLAGAARAVWMLVGGPAKESENVNLSSFDDLNTPRPKNDLVGSP